MMIYHISQIAVTASKPCFSTVSLTICHTFKQWERAASAQSCGTPGQPTFSSWAVRPCCPKKWNLKFQWMSSSWRIILWSTNSCKQCLVAKLPILKVYFKSKRTAVSGGSKCWRRSSVRGKGSASEFATFRRLAWYGQCSQMLAQPQRGGCWPEDFPLQYMTVVQQITRVCLLKHVSKQIGL